MLELMVFDKFADIVSSVDYVGRPFVADIEGDKTVWHTVWYTDDRPPAVE